MIVDVFLSNVARIAFNTESYMNPIKTERPENRPVPCIPPKKKYC